MTALHIISHICSTKSSKKLVKKNNPAGVKQSPTQIAVFAQTGAGQIRITAQHVKLREKENFCYKISIKSSYSFDHDNCYASNMERLFFP